MTDQEGEVEFLQDLARDDGRVVLVDWRTFVREGRAPGAAWRALRWALEIDDGVLCWCDWARAFAVTGTVCAVLCANAALWELLKRWGDLSWLHFGRDDVICDVFDEDSLALRFISV
jgi:hypothetical protein